MSREECDRLHEEVQLLLLSELQKGDQQKREEERMEALLAHTHTQLELLRGFTHTLKKQETVSMTLRDRVVVYFHTVFCIFIFCHIIIIILTELIRQDNVFSKFIMFLFMERLIKLSVDRLCK